LGAPLFRTRDLGFERIGRVALYVRRDVRVEVKRHRDVRVA
jgi:hypothetical protein